MRGLPSILSFFRNEFDKFNNTRARMLDSVRFYLSYDIKITLKSHFFEISNQLELFPYSPILLSHFGLVDFISLSIECLVNLWP